MKRFLLSICAGGSLLFTPLLYAQAGGIGSPQAGRGIYPGTPGQPAERPAPVRIKQLDFQGGKPEDLLAAMKEASGVKPNVIIHPEAATVQIPVFTLRDVTANQVFTALNMIGEPGQSPMWQPVNSEDGEIWTLMPARRQNSGIDPLTGIPFGQPQFGQPQMARQTPSPARQVRVFNLTGVLDEYTIEDVTTAVKGAWELMNSGEEPTVKYHKDTKLLIVVGDPNQLNVVSQVTTELMNNIAMKHRGSAKPADPAAKQDATKKQ